MPPLSLRPGMASIDRKTNQNNCGTALQFQEHFSSSGSESFLTNRGVCVRRRILSQQNGQGKKGSADISGFRHQVSPTTPFSFILHIGPPIRGRKVRMDVLNAILSERMVETPSRRKSLPCATGHPQNARRSTKLVFALGERRDSRSDMGSLLRHHCGGT